MAHSILPPGRRLHLSESERLDSEPEGRHLTPERLGVIGGFLVGLPVGISLVGEPLSSFGAPQWLVVGMTALVVAVFIRIGFSLGFSSPESDEL